MNAINHPISTAADVIGMLKAADFSPLRRRDLLSSISRLCAMLGCRPEALKLDVRDLGARLSGIRPAAHQITKKSLSTLRSEFAAALEFAGVADGLGRGDARRDANWAPLVDAVSADQRRANGLAAFMNWCSRKGIQPDEVDDEVVQRFATWLETRTLYPRPRNRIRGIPQIWNEARGKVDGWPDTQLARISFRAPSENLLWGDLHPNLREEADAYLKLRAEPDLFETDPAAPRRPLAPATVRQQREYIRLAVSMLERHPEFAGAVQTLADLVEPAAFKAIMRHYHGRAEGKPNAFVVIVAKTLIDVARYAVKVAPERLTELKAIAAKLPAIPSELTEKNQELIRLLENQQTRARLLFMPDACMRKVKGDLQRGLLDFVEAQVAIAVDLLLVAPLRPQNLIALNWTLHFKEPQGVGGKLLLYIPKLETKSKKRDLTFEIAEDAAEKVRWYRREIMPRLGADPAGDLFVLKGGESKGQETLTAQIVESISDRVGIHMTPHQFRHVAAVLYLEEHPEDFQSISDLLGHAWAKTTLIYAGSSSRRASKAYGSFIIGQREALKLKQGVKRPKRRRA